MGNKERKKIWEEFESKGSPSVPTKKIGEFVNLTPHNINVVLPDNTIKTYNKSNIIARVNSKMIHPFIISGIPVYQQLYGEIIDLPEPKSGIYFIVSSIVKLAYEREVKNGYKKERYDLVVPSNFVKDAEGNILGCKSFIR